MTSTTPLYSISTLDDCGNERVVGTFTGRQRTIQDSKTIQVSPAIGEAIRWFKWESKPLRDLLVSAAVPEHEKVALYQQHILRNKALNYPGPTICDPIIFEDLLEEIDNPTYTPQVVTQVTHQVITRQLAQKEELAQIQIVVVRN